MAYYFDQRAEIEGSLREDAPFAQAVRRDHPSLLKKKLAAIHRHD